jgi:hypothetical protein
MINIWRGTTLGSCQRDGWCILTRHLHGRRHHRHRSPSPAWVLPTCTLQIGGVRSTEDLLRLNRDFVKVSQLSNTKDFLGITTATFSAFTCGGAPLGPLTSMALVLPSSPACTNIDLGVTNPQFLLHVRCTMGAEKGL